MMHVTSLPTTSKDVTRRPVLTYGTLRHGQGNYTWLIQPHPHSFETVQAAGFRMHGGIGFPYVVQDDSYAVVADLITYLGDDEGWMDFLDGLDGLEGYRGVDQDGIPSDYNHYDRVVTSVVTAQGETIEAYIYVANRTVRRVDQLPIVEHGDWLAFVRSAYRPRFENPTYDFLND